MLFTTPKYPRGNKRLRRPSALAEEFLAPGLGEFLARSNRCLRHSEKTFAGRNKRPWGFSVLPLNYRPRRTGWDSNPCLFISSEVPNFYTIPANLVLLFKFKDVVYYSLGPSINSYPTSTTYTVLVGSDVEHITFGSNQRVSDCGSRLFVG